MRPDAKMDGSKPISGGIPHCFPQVRTKAYNLVLHCLFALMDKACLVPGHASDEHTDSSVLAKSSSTVSHATLCGTSVTSARTRCAPLHNLGNNQPQHRKIVCTPSE